MIENIKVYDLLDKEIILPFSYNESIIKKNLFYYNAKYVEYSNNILPEFIIKYVNEKHIFIVNMVVYNILFYYDDKFCYTIIGNDIYKDINSIIEDNNNYKLKFLKHNEVFDYRNSGIKPYLNETDQIINIPDDILEEWKEINRYKNDFEKDINNIEKYLSLSNISLTKIKNKFRKKKLNNIIS